MLFPVYNHVTDSMVDYLLNAIIGNEGRRESTALMRNSRMRQSVASAGAHFTRWWEIQRMPWLDWIHLEVTTRCNAACAYCPRTVYGSQWENRDLSFEIFEELMPVFTKARRVHLQGWGEPLLHKDFFDMVARIKKIGKEVGTTSNGILLDRWGINRLVRSGIDNIAFSLTGLGDKNDKARKGTDFTKILQVISGIAAEKKTLQIDTPKVHVSYLLFRSHLPDIQDMVPMLADHGIEQVVVSTLDFVSNKELQKESLRPQDEREYRELTSLLDKLTTAGDQAGLNIYYCLAHPGKRSKTCTENAGRALFVSADGMVSPCVYMNIPAAGIHHVTGDCEIPYERLHFGNLSSHSLPAIWQSPDYSMFRDFFDKASNAFCSNCPKRYES
jgi:MoaA/NifB/PqqE/SkfB family radical SAM enzyme